MTAKLPRATADLIPGKGPMAQEFYRFFLELTRQQAGSASATDLTAINQQIAALQAEINGLPEGGSYPILQVVAPLVSMGLLQNGYAKLAWNGTTDDVPEGTTNLYYTDARADARIAAHDTVPCFLSDGTPSYMPLASDLTIPCFLSDGTPQSLPLAA